MDRVEELKAMLAARQGVPGFERNCIAIEAEIARITERPKRARKAGQAKRA